VHFQTDTNQHGYDMITMLLAWSVFIRG